MLVEKCAGTPLRYIVASGICPVISLGGSVAGSIDSTTVESTNLPLPRPSNNSKGYTTFILRVTRQKRRVTPRRMRTPTPEGLAEFAVVWISRQLRKGKESEIRQREGVETEGGVTVAGGFSTLRLRPAATCPSRDRINPTFPRPSRRSMEAPISRTFPFGKLRRQPTESTRISGGKRGYRPMSYPQQCRNPPMAFYTVKSNCSCGEKQELPRRRYSNAANQLYRRSPPLTHWNRSCQKLPFLVSKFTPLPRFRFYIHCPL